MNVSRVLRMSAGNRIPGQLMTGIGREFYLFQSVAPDPLLKVLYTANTTTSGGGRDGGHSKSDDGRLSIAMSMPGGAGTGTNPEQLFAAAYSACFIGALRGAAGKQKIKLPLTAAVDATVQLGTTDSDSYSLAMQLIVSLPGLDKKIGSNLVEAAREICPFSNATRGNIAVDIRLK